MTGAGARSVYRTLHAVHSHIDRMRTHGCMASALGPLDFRPDFQVHDSTLDYLQTNPDAPLLISSWPKPLCSMIVHTYSVMGEESALTVLFTYKLYWY